MVEPKELVIVCALAEAGSYDQMQNTLCTRQLVCNRSRKGVVRPACRITFALGCSKNELRELALEP
jgi:hypothetical protein